MLVCSHILGGWLGAARHATEPAVLMYHSSLPELTLTRPELTRLEMTIN